MNLTVKVKWKGKNLPQEWMKFSQKLRPYLELAHKKCVMAIVADAVVWSRVDTGRMRAGWLPYLIQNNYPYESLLGTRSKDYQGSVDIEGFVQVDEPFHTILEDAVKYTEYVEDKVGVFDTEGKSAYRPAPYATLEEASQVWGNKYGMRMQMLIDNAAKSWNEGKHLTEPDDSQFPLPGETE